MKRTFESKGKHRIAQGSYEQAQEDAQEQNIPVAVFVWQIKSEDIVDHPVGAERYTVCNKTICCRNIGRKAITINQ